MKKYWLTTAMILTLAPAAVAFEIKAIEPAIEDPQAVIEESQTVVEEPQAVIEDRKAVSTVMSDVPEQVEQDKVKKNGSANAAPLADWSQPAIDVSGVEDLVDEKNLAEPPAATPMAPPAATQVADLPPEEKEPEIEPYGWLPAQFTWKNAFEVAAAKYPVEMDRVKIKAAYHGHLSQNHCLIVNAVTEVDLIGFAERTEYEQFKSGVLTVDRELIDFDLDLAAFPFSVRQLSTNKNLSGFEQFPAQTFSSKTSLNRCDHAVAFKQSIKIDRFDVPDLKLDLRRTKDVIANSGPNRKIRVVYFLSPDDVELDGVAGEFRGLSITLKPNRIGLFEWRRDERLGPYIASYTIGDDAWTTEPLKPEN